VATRATPPAELSTAFVKQNRNFLRGEHGEEGEAR
jgi:hypothetical protein